MTPLSPTGVFILVSEITGMPVACAGESSVGFFGVLLGKALGISRDRAFPPHSSRWAVTSFGAWLSLYLEGQGLYHRHLCIFRVW